MPLSAVILFAVSSCVKSEETAIDREPSISVPLKTAGTGASSQFVTVDAAGPWTITIDFGEAEEWASVEPAAGEDRRSDIVLSWEKNEGKDARSCILTVVAGEMSASATFTQNGTAGTGGGPSEIKADIPGKWLELPATDDTDLYFITHDMVRSGKTLRNYSYYYSLDDRLAVWVAYPLNRGLIGSGSRTDDWGYDPKIPSRYQPVLFSGYRGGYDRGHQLPSADRYGNGINETTFYFTNMTPQKAALNQSAWANLENMVRDWCYQMDTLYVVTGPIFDSEDPGRWRYTEDNIGNPVAVPDGYFKALLSYDVSANVYYSVAFVYDNKEYGRSNPSREDLCSVSEVEEMTGFAFFNNLPQEIAESVKSQLEPSRWGY